MKTSKHGSTVLLKILYGLLFALSLVIIITFYLDKNNSNQQAYELSLEKQIEGLAVQIDKMAIEKILFSDQKEFEKKSFSEEDYRQLRSIIMASNDIINIESSEIRILQQEKDLTVRTLISTDDIYKYGEIHRDRTGVFSHNISKTIKVFTKVNEDLTKIYLTTPILGSSGEPLAYLQASAPESPYQDKMNYAMIKNVAILLAVYFILGMFFMRSLKSNRKGIASELIKIKQIKEQLEVKNKELHLLSLIAESSKDLILITDHKGIILWINDVYKNRNNYTQSEIEHFIGQSLHNVSKNKQIGNIIKNASSFKEEFTYETKSLDKNGNEFWAETIVRPVLKNEELSQIIFIDRDISEKMRLKEQLTMQSIQKKPTVNSIINQ